MVLRTGVRGYRARSRILDHPRWRRRNRRAATGFPGSAAANRRPPVLAGRGPGRCPRQGSCSGSGGGAGAHRAGRRRSLVRHVARSRRRLCRRLDRPRGNRRGVCPGGNPRGWPRSDFQREPSAGTSWIGGVDASILRSQACVRCTCCALRRGASPRFIEKSRESALGSRARRVEGRRG
jgi:hypothetical protein